MHCLYRNPPTFLFLSKDRTWNYSIYISWSFLKFSELRLPLIVWRYCLRHCLFFLFLYFRYIAKSLFTPVSTSVHLQITFSDVRVESIMCIGQQPPSSNPWTTLRFYPSTSRTIGNKYTKQNHRKVCSVIKLTIYIRSRKSYIFPLYLLFSFFSIGGGGGHVYSNKNVSIRVFAVQKGRLWRS